MATPLRPSSPRRFPTQAVLIALGLLVALNLLVVAVIRGGQEQTAPLPTEIEAVHPVPNATIRPQQEIGADLLDQYTGVLFIDDVEVPLDQLTIEPALGKVTFRPAEGKDIIRLTPGPHAATIEYWHQEKERGPDTSKSFTWQFVAG